MQYGLVPEFSRISLPKILSTLLIVQTGVDLGARKHVLLSIVNKAVGMYY